MICPRCGKNNPEEATACSVCGTQLLEPARQVPMRPRTSGLAIAALVVGIVGLLTFVVPAIVALPLGIIALSQINRSRGRLSGKGLAIGGICLGGCSLLLVPLLLAVLFPVFARAREAARKAQCLSNVKNLALAVQMYQADWNVFPDGAQWCDVTGEYTKGAQVYACPSAPAPRCAYAYNAALSRQAAASLPDPGQTIALFESDRGWDAAGDESLMCAKPRHLGGDNWGYADGHAQWWPRGQGPATPNAGAPPPSPPPSSPAGAPRPRSPS
jgi:hypothetical protein